MTAGMTKKQIEAHLVELVREDRLQIPPFPAAVVQFDRTLRSNAYSNASLARIIGADQALTAAVIRQANCAALGGRAVASIEGAIGLLGARELEQIAIGLSFGALLKAGGPLSSLKAKMWRAASGVATLSATLALRRELDSGEAFVSGLLHNFGQAVALTCCEEIFRAQHASAALSGEEWDELISTYEPELGLVLSAKWKLPGPIVAVVTRYRVPNLATEHRALVGLVALARQIFTLVDTQPGVGSRELAAIEGVQPSEVGPLVDVVARLPAAIDRLQPDGLHNSPPAPVVAQPTSTFEGATADVSWPAVRIWRRKELTYRAVRLNHSAVALLGAEPMAQNTVVQLRLDDPSAPLDFWGTVLLDTPHEGQHYIEVRPMSLDTPAKVVWANALKQALANPATRAAPAQVPSSR